MLDSIKQGTSTATVADETDVGSAVTVTGEGYTVTFDGNNFASKHLRRIRRNSISALQNPLTSPGKLSGYAKEARGRAAVRWGGKESSTNSIVYLDLGQFCQFGSAIITFLKGDTANAWSPYPANAPITLQKHATVTIGKCLAYSHSGVGAVRSGGDGTVEGGVGITLSVTVRQVGTSATIVEVCHYESGTVTGKLASDKLDPKTQGAKMHSIAGTIIS